MAIFYVIICRVYDEKKEMDNDGDNKEALHKWNGTIQVKKRV